MEEGIIEQILNILFEEETQHVGLLDDSEEMVKEEIYSGPLVATKKRDEE